ncbi:recombinase family protein [Streptomyces sp. NPDC091377]|uniref:recombinase family protein n=1 Tax=Streptomyces sp. NPDC091377 TaxID=3365995 RepID=UPI00382B2354
MDLTPDQAADAVERHDCPKCEAPAGSPCRTQGGETAAKYHTARFTLVSKLREELEVPVPADRGPGRAWVERPPLPAGPVETGSVVIRIGYARCSMAEQEIASQLVALEKAGCTKVFQEKISTRVHRRPEMEAALALANNIKEAAPDQVVILTVHEMKRLARNTAELMQLSSAGCPPCTTPIASRSRRTPSPPRSAGPAPCSATSPARPRGSSGAGCWGCGSAAGGHRTPWRAGGSPRAGRTGSGWKPRPGLSPAHSS